MTADRHLLIVEDDETFARTLRRSFERRGYRVSLAAGARDLPAVLGGDGPGLGPGFAPGFAVVDLKLGSESGLPCIAALHAHDPAMLIVVLTGFASISTAVEAIKLGASHYLAKPSNADDIEAAFAKAGAGDAAVPIGDRPSSIKTVEWEHINETLAATGFNISETARRLGMHRRTLARKLDKRPVK